MNVSAISSDAVVEKMISLLVANRAKIALMEEVSVINKEDASFEEAVHWVSCKGKPVVIKTESGDLLRFIPGAPAEHPGDIGKIFRVWYRTESHSEIL